MGELAGKVAIVTGGGSGIGSSTARLFAEEGASVVVVDIIMERAEKVVQSIKSKGGVGFAIRADLFKQDEINRLVQETMQEFGKIDILVNSAGMGSRSGTRNGVPDCFLENLTEELWEKVMDINLKSVFLLCKQVIPIMKKQKSGNIINIASSAAFRGCQGEVGSGAHYNVSKAGVVNLTKTLALQYGPHGIRANTIAPGFMYGADPDGTKSASFGWATPEDTEKGVKTIPLRRMGTPGDIADAILFLASDKSRYVHGATLHVNGGTVME
jgi:NAD(P)-dependent dehydrogenase (short-subunit alcohol dehydrogenase family)